MYLRLAFSVAAHLEPELLLVDEVLAVGDAEFQRKCLGRMHEAEEEGRTLLFVSHDLESLGRLCRRSIWLEAGRIRDAGPTDGVVRDYLASSMAAGGAAAPVYESSVVTVQEVRVVPADAPAGSLLMRGDRLRVEAVFEVTEDLPGLDVAVLLTSSRGVRVVDEVLSDRTAERLGPGRYRVALTVPVLLNVGDYTAGVWFGTPYEELLDLPTAARFTVHGSDLMRPDRVVVLEEPFEVERLDPGP
jgi:ABC-2 type transport system ATP-binding protein/lipopolysaccharide transport system ATP-binding protein